MIRRALVCTGVGTLVLVTLASCPNIGNDMGGTCSTGQTCVCDILGNCQKTCPSGGCHFVCQGTGNCLFDCEGGGCDLTCQNTGNCILSCPGNDCRITCAGGKNNCILRPCQKSCPRDGGPDAPRVDRGRSDLARDLRRDAKRDAKKGDGPKVDGAKSDGPKSDAKHDVLAPDACLPATCAQLGKNCGSVSDGCGGSMSCGTTCTAGSCGGGGTQGVCGCATTATAGPISPGSGSNSALVGTFAWTSPGEIVSANAGTGSPPPGVAWAFLYAGHSPSNYLVASGFGLSIPSTALINGVQVEIRRQASLGGSNIADSDVRLLSGSTSLTGNRASSTAWTSTWTYVTYGGPADLWGRLWTPAELNGPGLGVALSARWIGASGNDTALVDHVRLTVYYASTCCLPKSCIGEGRSCGLLDDGCGSILSCGTCATGDTCSGAGKCGCANGVKDGVEPDVDCGGICPTTCAQGKSCKSLSDCAAALFCVDGTCCNTQCSGLCQACVVAKTGTATGTCANVSAGSDPDLECAQEAVSTCGKTGMCKNGACELYPASTACAPTSCTGGQTSAAKACDGAGLCIGPAPVPCPAPYVCNAAATACQSCTDGAKNGGETDLDCGGSSAACARCTQGKTCSGTSDCAAGLSCADGVCCNSACTAVCMACVFSKTGTASGTCANITAGSDPDIECNGQKKCVNGACQ